MRYRPLVPVPELGAGAVCADDVREQLLAWKAAVEARGGRFVVNSLTRTAVQQQALRDKYLAWLKAGKPRPAVAAANRPGKSNHQGGRAIDISTVSVFPDEPADRQVDLLWETGRPHGFTPIIAQPDETMSERWHFDCWNDWRGVKDYMGYETGCLCSALDVGQAADWQSDPRLIQALLLRAGVDVGEPDGVAGPRTRAGLRLALGDKYAQRYTSTVAVIAALRLLPARLTNWTTARA